jgi:ribosomal protein S13
MARVFSVEKPEQVMVNLTLTLHVGTGIISSQSVCALSDVYAHNSLNDLIVGLELAAPA